HHPRARRRRRAGLHRRRRAHLEGLHGAQAPLRGRWRAVRAHRLDRQSLASTQRVHIRGRTALRARAVPRRPDRTRGRRAEARRRRALRRRRSRPPGSQRTNRQRAPALGLSQGRRALTRGRYSLRRGKQPAVSRIRDRIGLPAGLGLGLTLVSAMLFSCLGVLTQLAFSEGATVGTLLSGRFLTAAAIFWPLVWVLRTRRPGRLQIAGGLVLGAGYSAHA